MSLLEDLRAIRPYMEHNDNVDALERIAAALGFQPSDYEWDIASQSYMSMPERSPAVERLMNDLQEFGYPESSFFENGSVPPPGGSTDFLPATDPPRGSAS